MKPALLDTDTLSYVLDKRYPEVNETARQYLRVFRYFSISSATLAEVVRGFEKDQNGRAAAKFLVDAEGFEVFPFGTSEAALAGEILGALDRKGLSIGREDPFIAATVIINERVLITNNLKHYQRIVDLGYSLQLDNWRKGE